MATRLPYYTGTDDVYSQLMAQYAQEQPYYSATPYNAGGYDTTLYYRPPVVQIGGGGNYSGLLGGAGGFSGGPDTISPPNKFADPNSLTNGLIAALFGQDPSMVAVDSIGGNLGNLNSVNIGLDIGQTAAGGGGGNAGAGPGADPSMDSSGLVPADGGDGGGAGGGGACVIATHAVASGAFTPKEKRQAVKWCVKNLHRTWWGEAIRRGYRFYGRKAIEAGKAKNHYEEFRDYVAFATGTRKTPKTALTFAWRNVQFFVTGIFVKD